MTFFRVLGTELTKLRRSKVTWVTLAACTLMVAFGAFFMWMMMHPDAARSLGLLGQKASFAFAGQATDWKSYLTFIVEMGGFGGLVFCSVIVAYVFGREYVEGTAKNMLALPVPRSLFVAVKLLVSAAWWAVLTGWIIVVAWIAGSMLQMPAYSAQLLRTAATRLAVLAALSFSCSTIVAWISVETRGYFAPLGFAIFAMVLATVFGHTGWGPWVPWSIVGLYSGATAPESALGWGSYAVIAATFLVGSGLTIRHEVFADNTQ
ncbi:MAG TPA: ABC transporter permease [Spirochaetia bacterium]|nr:ABC transporter permease [Spirochaetia bacterium]